MGEAVDLVIGSTALLGHEVGADSPLMREMVLHLDRQIEVTLDRRLTPRKYVSLIANRS